MPAAGILDGLVGTILGILSGGYRHLTPELRILLELLVGLELMFGAIAYVGAHFGVFQWFITKTIRMCIFVFLFTSYALLTQMIIDYFVWGGLSIAGVVSSGQLTVEEFHHPSIVIMKGFEATAPINRFIENHTGWGMMWNFFILLMMSIASMGIWVAFMLATLHLIFVLLSTYTIAVFSFLYLVFGVFGPLAFLAERGIAMFLAAASRLGVLALITAIMFPFVDFFMLPIGPELDPGMAEAWWLVLGSVLFILTSWLIPSIIHMMAAGGPLLSWTNLVPGASLFMPSASGGGSSGSSAATPPREPVNPRNTMPGSAYY